MVAKLRAAKRRPADGEAATSASLASAFSSTSTRRFKGVRMRSWGKWVSEIRLPNTRARLWLGSFATAEQAARAFDVAVVCLRGRSAPLNFPDSPPIYAPLGLSHHQIQELATAAASAAAVPDPSNVTKSEPSSNSLKSDYDNTHCSSSAPSSRASSTTSPRLSDSTSSLFAVSEASTSAESCTTPYQDTNSLESFLRLNGNAETPQTVPQVGLSVALGYPYDEEVRLEELLSSSSLSFYWSWEQQLKLLSLPSPPEDDAPSMVEPALWQL
ncbi:hypothetical protein KP509_16G002100 [Ceratopteris richardii]|uniref:AP2/ERF domain-containing protein n=1 Tax=Ceratopteris richardii TaxID=49495 RepID=A0A8T2T0C4_CERRI|nr:hypothetical protein KP509_16G002100 [Ceratopteris richardii]